jgi:hypothetical protein
MGDVGGEGYALVDAAAARIVELTPNRDGDDSGE